MRSAIVNLLAIKNKVKTINPGRKAQGISIHMIKDEQLK